MKKLAPLASFGNISVWARQQLAQQDRLKPSVSHFNESMVVAPSARIDHDEIGRRIEPIAQRCGMLSSFREAALGGVSTAAVRSRSAERATSSSSIDKASKAVVRISADDATADDDGPPPSRLSACWKCEVSDTQINEIAGGGEITTLMHRPKGQWRKMAKNKTISIEVDSRQEFGHPDKDFTKRIIDYGVYRRVRDFAPADRPWSYFQLYREGATVGAVLDRFRHRCGVKPTDVVLDSEEDAFACVAQVGAVLHAGHETIKHASRFHNIHPIILNPVAYHASPPPRPLGNYYRVLLRCVEGTREEIEARVAWMSRDTTRCANYISITAFSANANLAHSVGALAARGKYHDALCAMLQNEAVAVPVIGWHYARYLSASPDTEVGVLRASLIELEGLRMHRGSCFGRVAQAIVQSAVNGGSKRNADEAFMPELWEAATETERRRSVFENAPAYYLWNAAASQRLISGGACVRVGDVVWDADRGRIDVVKAREEGKWSIDDIVLPVVSPLRVELAQRSNSDVGVMFPRGTGSTDKQFYIDFCRMNSWFDNSASTELKSIDLAAATAAPVHYRKLFVKANDIQSRVMEDASSTAVLKSDHFLSQERLAPVVGLDADRIREPHPLNVSLAFEESMTALRQQEMRRFLHEQGNPVRRAPVHSVAMSVRLPAGTHVSTWLREVFDVRCLHVSDMMNPAWVDAGSVAFVFDA